MIELKVNVRFGRVDLTEQFIEGSMVVMLLPQRSEATVLDSPGASGFDDLHKRLERQIVEFSLLKWGVKPRYLRSYSPISK